MKPEYFKIRSIDAQHDAPINDDKLVEEVKLALLKDDYTQKFKDLMRLGPRELGKDLKDWNFENGLLLYRGKIYIPKTINDDL